MAHRHGQTVGRPPKLWPPRIGSEIGHQRDPRRWRVRQAEDAQAAHLDQPGQSRRRLGDPVDDIDPVIRHQQEPAIQQPQQKVGFPAAGRPDQKDARTIPRGTTSMDLHMAGM